MYVYGNSTIPKKIVPTLIFLLQFWPKNVIFIDKSYIKSVKLQNWTLSGHNLLQK